MSEQLNQRLFTELDSLVLVDPHSHIEPASPASTTLADLLGYHYYTELAHSAGMPRERIEEPGMDPREKVRRLVERLSPLENTIQYSWMIELCQRFFGFEDERLTPDNWEELYDAAEKKMSATDWPETVLKESKIEAVFLTNNFDNSLEGFDTKVYVPCLRTDDLVFHLAEPDVRKRLTSATGIEATDLESLRGAVEKLFIYFTKHGARACAISLPPDFSPKRIDDALAAEAVASACRGEAKYRHQVAQVVFWMLAEFCDEYRLPFDLMIGVKRAVYLGGVYQGRDLFDSRVSLVQYEDLFNEFPDVTFPVSVLASVTNHELVAYSWIFPNVVTSGHWWYSNTPTFIAHDLSARLEAVPQTKQIGYYSDAYKLEFILPKFGMYKRVLAKVLAENFVRGRGWSEERAIDLGRQILRDNVEGIFLKKS